MSPTLAPVHLNINMVKTLRQLLGPVIDPEIRRSLRRKYSISIPTVEPVIKWALPLAFVTRVTGKEPIFLFLVSPYDDGKECDNVAYSPVESRTSKLTM